MYKTHRHPVFSDHFRSLNERVNDDADKAQKAGLGDVAATLLECQELIKKLRFGHCDSAIYVRGTVAKVAMSSYAENANYIFLVKVHVSKEQTGAIWATVVPEVMKGKEKPMTGDKVTCEGTMTRTSYLPVVLFVEHFEITRKVNQQWHFHPTVQPVSTSPASTSQNRP
jgi:hypothetical protein